MAKKLTANEKRLAERKRVDEFMHSRQAGSRKAAAAKKKLPPTKHETAVAKASARRKSVEPSWITELSEALGRAKRKKK